MKLTPNAANETVPAAAYGEDAEALNRTIRRPLIGRIRFELGGALLFGVLLPTVLRWPLTALHLATISNSVIAPSLIGCALAIVLAYVLIRQFTAFPGVRATTYILPSLLLCFTAVALVMFFSRIDYSRYIILASLALSVIWLQIAYALRYRYARPTLALLPDGNHRGVAEIPGAHWVTLVRPTDSLRNIDGIVADLHESFSPVWERFIATCTLAGIPVYHAQTISESLTGRVEVEHLSENSFGTVLPSNLYLRLKRAIDLAIAVVLLVPFLLVIVAAAIAIRLESPGPALFRQLRMGFRGKTFVCLKLRSMRHGGDQGRRFTDDGDPRITRVGRFIRKYRIDEMPQIFNILRGEMSWMGPRPEAVELAEWYARDVPFYIYRHAVRPGITGWAQVNQGNVAEVANARVKLQYDFYYIKNFSPMLDLLILLKTVRTILTGFGSK